VAPDWLETMQSVIGGVGQQSTLTGLRLGLVGPRQGWTWVGSGRPGPDTCRSLVQPCCGFGLLLGLWFTWCGSPWTRMHGAWTEGPVRGGLSPPLLPPCLGPQRTRCTRVQLPSSFPPPKLLCSHRGVPGNGEWAVGWLLVKSCPPPLLSSIGGRQGRLNVVPMTDRHGSALARL
jgi:hypothetical protein